MFYEQLVLARKGPLGHVWLAAHWEKKLTKQQIAETNIPDTVDRIKNPRAPMALRLSGHLLLGVVRIYNKKVDYLYTDANDALGKAFRPDRTELDERVTNIRSITLPETVADFEVVLPGDISTQQLPEVAEEMATFNVSQATDVVGQPDEPQSPRGRRRREAEREPSSQGFEPPRLGAEELIDVNVPFPLEGEPIEPGPELPQGDFELPGFEENPLVAPWLGEAAEPTPPAVVLADLPALERAERLRRARRAVDRRTELTGKSMEKLVANPDPLMRDMRIAPGTPALIDIRLRSRLPLCLNFLIAALSELEVGIDGMFDEPAFALPGPLRAMMRSTASATRGPTLLGPSSELDRSIEQVRGGPAEEAAPLGGDELELPPMDFEALGEEAPLSEREWLPSEAPGAAESAAEADEVEREVAEAEAEGRGFIITKRTARIHQFLAKQFKEAGPKTPLSFFKLWKKATRHEAATAFFEILNIKSKGCIEVAQKEAYEDFNITKTVPNLFNRAMLISGQRDFEKLTA